MSTFDNRVEITDIYNNGLVDLRQAIKGKEGEIKLPKNLLESQATTKPKIELPGKLLRLLTFNRLYLLLVFNRTTIRAASLIFEDRLHTLVTEFGK